MECFTSYNISFSRQDRVTFEDEDEAGDEEYFESVQLEAVKEPLKERF